MIYAIVGIVCMGIAFLAWLMGQKGGQGTQFGWSFEWSSQRCESCGCGTFSLPRDGTWTGHHDCPRCARCGSMSISTNWPCMFCVLFVIAGLALLGIAAFRLIGSNLWHWFLILFGIWMTQVVIHRLHKKKAGIRKSQQINAANLHSDPVVSSKEPTWGGVLEFTTYKFLGSDLSRDFSNFNTMLFYAAKGAKHIGTVGTQRHPTTWRAVFTTKEEAECAIEGLRKVGITANMVPPECGNFTRHIVDC